MKTTSSGHDTGRTCSSHVLSMFCAFSFHVNSMNNLLSYFGLVDAKIRASDKDLPVLPIAAVLSIAVVTVTMNWRQSSGCW